MKRRSFIKRSSAISLPFMLNGMPLNAIGNSSLMNLINGDSDRVLVLVQLNGGNDGLNTLIPLDQYDNLAQVRQNLLLPEQSILEIGNDLGFHPNMVGMKDMWDAAKLSVLQSVGYPNQNRSHFRSTDIWHSASEAGEYLNTGWMGRYLDSQFDNYPFDYPNADCPDPFALTIGTVVSETCQGQAASFSLVLDDVYNPGTINEGVEGPVPNNCYGSELTYVRQVVHSSNAYAEVIQSAAEKGNSLSDKYGADNGLAQKLKQVALLISGGLQTKVYVVQIGGFDTHSAQVDPNDTTGGRHGNLMSQLSQALCAFQEDLSLLGLEKRVIGMTYSEFGRQIRANESDGTDHGTAAPLFVFGSCVNSTILGQNPEIDTQVAPQEGVPMQIDFRSVYCSILMDWFGAEEDAVKNLIYEDFQYLPIIEGCDVSSTNGANTLDDVRLNVFPNPFADYIKLTFESEDEDLRISLFDARGAEVKVISNRRFGKGIHDILVEVRELRKGTYFVRLAGHDKVKTKKIIKG